jgi:ribosome-binding factor A
MIPPSKNIKHAQKEATLLRLVSHLFLEVGLDNPNLRPIVVSRVKLSPDGSICTVYFYTSAGKELYDQFENTLKLYKPSLRKAIAAQAAFRHTPDFRFHFDDHVDKQKHLEELFESIKKDQ